MLEYDDLELRSWLATLDADPRVEWVDAQRDRLAASWESRTITAVLPAAVQFSTISESFGSKTTRSRRYRRLGIAAAAAAVLALVIVVVAVALAAVDRRSVQTPLRPVSTPPTSTLAPLVQGPDAASTLLTASWGQVPFANVLIYADGRVIRYGDVGVNERRLTRRGLDLVRAGKLDAKWFLGQGVLRPYPHWKIWADRAPRIWRPSKYAICPTVPPEVMDQLRPPAQNVLRGTEHTYHGTPILGDDPRPPGPPESPRECLEVTRGQVRTLVEILDDDFQVDTGSIDFDRPDGEPIQITFKGRSGTDVFVASFRPLLPHGDWVSY
jgi:hypothetical protein